MAKRPSWYQWALRVPDFDYGERGLGFAQQLAKNALARKAGAPPPIPPKLTIAELARDWRLSQTTVRRELQRAREDRFGPIGDRAIQNQLSQPKKKGLGAWQPCARDGCDVLFRPTRRGHRFHRDACRVAFHRAKQ